MAEKQKQDANNSRFSIKMQKKLVVLYVAVLLAFVLLCVRLVWITREKGTQYEKQVLSQQKYDSTVIPYRRGDIVDSKGTILATSEKVYNLVIDAKVMNYAYRDKLPYLEPTLEALGNYFDLDMAKIREYVTANKNSSYYVPLKRLTYEQIRGFKEAQAAKDSNINGVWFEEEYKRVYPYGSLASDLIGFTNAGNVGNYGLEEQYNNTLNGINGREYGYLNEDLNLERTVKAAVDGNSLHTTIDANVQMTVEKHLRLFNEENKDAYTPGNGAENVGCVMMWVDTGEILAMASYPSFDLNDVRNTDKLIGSRLIEQFTNPNGYFENRKTDTIITESVLEGLDSSQVYLNLNNLWKNFCITNTYEPGSTAKPFTVAMGLELGTITPDQTFVCDRFLEVGGHKIKCQNHPAGTLTLQEAVAKSCNVSMMRIAQTIGNDEFCRYQNTFNFGLKTNIDLAGEARTASLIYTADDMGPTDLATNSFGQNFNVTMIQLITGFCSLINGGYYYEPHVVDKITNASGATVANIEPRMLKQTVSESTSAMIRDYCRAAVDIGSGKTARPAGYRIGGKTGTAETIDPNTHIRSETEFVTSFIGYAPADDPKVAIYVVVDRPNAEKQASAKYATKLVRDILTEVLPYLNIFMTEEPTEAEKQELAALQLAITTQYTQTPEGDALNDLQGNTQPAADPENQPWMNFPIDPETGYRKDPETGDLYDPGTGITVGGESVPDVNIPVNPNIQ